MTDIKPKHANASAASAGSHCYRVLRTCLDGRVSLLQFEERVDPRGRLLPLEFHNLPFTPKRSFLVTGAPVGTVRGKHAHRTASQLLFCVSGRVDVCVRADGKEDMIVLAVPSAGLLMGPGVWAQQTYQTDGAVLLVMASEPFDASSYVQYSLDAP